MAVKDIIPIKYWIPKLDFTVRLGTSQYFKVMYKIYTDDWNNDIGWTVLREQYLVQPDGTTSESDKLVLSNLVENRTYVLRLVDNRSKNFDFKFKTGRNVALGDSPYYNKLLMPGQIYDWFISNMDGSDAPNKVEAEWYYRANCKFNNWVGERESGQGWAAPVYEGGSIKYTTEEVYKGKEGTNILKEEYCSQLLKLSNSLAGYADDKFHKWSIVWLPDRTLLYVDDVFISENRGFVPFNQMKLTIAGWFPTMPVAYRVTEDENGDQVKTAIGVTDRDGIHVTPGSVMTILDDTANTSIGTWAGTQANWQVCQMEVQSVEYLKYNAGENIVLNGKTSYITEEPMALGESFPESGLRYFITP